MIENKVYCQSEPPEVAVTPESEASSDAEIDKVKSDLPNAIPTPSDALPADRKDEKVIPTGEKSKAPGTDAAPSASKSKKKAVIVVKAEILKSESNGGQFCKLEFQARTFEKGDKVTLKTKKKSQVPSGFVTEELGEGKRVANLDLKAAKVKCESLVGSFLVKSKKNELEVRLEKSRKPKFETDFKVGQTHFKAQGLHILNPKTNLYLGSRTAISGQLALHPFAFREDPGAFHYGLQIGAGVSRESSSSLIKFDDDSQLSFKSFIWNVWLGYRFFFLEETFQLGFLFSPIGKQRLWSEQRKSGYYETKLLRSVKLSVPFFGVFTKFRLFSSVNLNFFARHGLGVAGKTDAISDEKAYNLVIKQTVRVDPNLIVETEDLATSGSLRSLKVSRVGSELEFMSSFINWGVFYELQVLKGNVLRRNSTFLPISLKNQIYGIKFTGYL